MKTLKIDSIKNAVNYNEIDRDKYYEGIYKKMNEGKYLYTNPATKKTPSSKKVNVSKYNI